ncbi:MAG TPA: pitrilysin family protein [Bacteroidales bacterium]|nr:pitrilysin family protein [Bacteroidales bacterium]
MNHFRKKGAPIYDFDAGVLNPATLKKSACGIPLYHITGNTMNVARIDFLFDAGAIFQTGKLIPSHCVSLLREGSELHTASEIAEILDYHAVFTEPSFSRNKAGMGFYIDLKSAATVLPVIAAFLFRPVFPQEELDIFNQNSFQRLKIDYEKVKILAGKSISTRLFGAKHPLGAEIISEDVFGVTRNQLTDFHRTHYHAQSCSIVVSGNVGEELFHIIDNAIQPYIGEQKTALIKPVYTEETSPEKFEYITKSGASQAAIRMGCLIDIDNMPDYHMLKVLNTLLGGYFGSRLMKNIREDKGLTYGIGSSVHLSGDKAVFNISAEVAGDTWQQALNEIDNELSALVDKPITHEELMLVKKTMLGDKLAMFDGAFASSAALRSLLEAGLYYNFIEDGISAIHKANEKILKNIATTMITRDKMTVVVAGPEA